MKISAEGFSGVSTKQDDRRENIFTECKKR